MATGAVHLRANMPFGVHVTTQSITHLSFRYARNRNRSQAICSCEGNPGEIRDNDRFLHSTRLEYHRTYLPLEAPRPTSNTESKLSYRGTRWGGILRVFPRLSTRKFVPCWPLWNLLSWTGLEI